MNSVEGKLYRNGESMKDFTEENTCHEMRERERESFVMENTS